MKRFASWLTVTGVVSLVAAGSALASPGDPPSFNVTTLTPLFNDFGTAMLAGVVVLIGVVLVIKTPFALVNIALKAIKRLFGKATPHAA